MKEDIFQLQDSMGGFKGFPVLPVEHTEEDEAIGGSYDEIPLLALKNTVLFPGVLIPITIGREKSIQAVKKAFSGDKMIGVVTQIDMSVESPEFKDLYPVGTVAEILKIIKMPNGSKTAIIRGKGRFQLDSILSTEPYLKGAISALPYQQPKDPLRFEATISAIMDQSMKVIDLSPNLPEEAKVVIKNIPNENTFLHFVTFYLDIDLDKKQSVLDEDDLLKKAKLVFNFLNEEIKILELKSKIEGDVKTEIEKQQKDYFLHQQMKSIQKELGENPQNAEIEKLRAKGAKKKWPKYAKKHFNKDLDKLSRINPQVAEFSVLLNYLEIFVELPWKKYTKDNFDLNKVKEVLDKDHHGLTKVKDRILEHLAVLKLKGDMKAPILCLVGPPGVGKTSLGKSIAEAINRKYIRMSLGGLHDESEIRGHRKTYIGAMPGRIIQSLKKVGSSNPVFILDEIDKVGANHRGDPSSALLEVLDPEQNKTFHDNYLDVDYDLSKILFIATANSLSSIQPALLDRMEIIQLSGYSVEEKIQIAKNYVVPEQLKEHGLKEKDVSISDETLLATISKYTREAGVRGLKRKIGGIMRNVAKNVATEQKYNKEIKPEDLKEILGPKLFSREAYAEAKLAGVAVGLAWTSVGGDILYIEASTSPGKGKLTLTGNLGDVMKESAITALSYIKSNAEALSIDQETLDKKDIHIHVPAGAIPKDGPSAGITMLSALTSAFTNRPLKPHLAMTGEITLRGTVLPVGGIKEKILAAKRAGIKEIILCHENKRHIDEIEAQYIEGLQFHFVKNMNEVLEIALT